MTIEVLARLDSETLATERVVEVTQADGTKLRAPLSVLELPDWLFEW